MEQLAFICAHLGQRQKQCIAHWLRTLTLDLFASRCVRPLQRYLDHLSRSQVVLCCLVRWVSPCSKLYSLLGK